MWPECIRIGKQIDAITAGERDGKVAEGLQHGNSPFEYPSSFIQGKTLVLTTTNGTKLLHMALDKGATDIITGSFSNLDAVCAYLQKKKTVILACAAWKDRVNMEDTLFAGAVIDRIGEQYSINCDASQLPHTLYKSRRTRYVWVHAGAQRISLSAPDGLRTRKDIRFVCNRIP